MSPERFVKGESERTFAFLSLGAVLLKRWILRPKARKSRTAVTVHFRWARKWLANWAVFL